MLRNGTMRLSIQKSRERRDSSGKVLISIEVRCGSRYRKGGDYVVVSEGKAVDDHEGVQLVVAMRRHSLTRRATGHDSDLTDGVK